MKRWKVWGEYGEFDEHNDGGLQVITRIIDAETAADALHEFYDDMEENHPEKWETMGRAYVFITEYKEGNT